MKKFSEFLEESEMLFEMANLSKNDTNLPVVVWISYKDDNHNLPRLKFQNNNSSNYMPSDLVPMSIDDNPKILKFSGKLNISNSDVELVKKWILLNKEALLEFWNGQISTMEVVRKLKPLD